MDHLPDFLTPEYYNMRFHATLFLANSCHTRLTSINLDRSPALF